MAHQFNKHYTLEEARQLLPRIRKWLKEAAVLRRKLEQIEERLRAMMKPGCDLGGELVNRWVETIAGVQVLLMEFVRREIQIKDLDRGLIDFPSLMDGREIFLCWEQEEMDIEFWHELHTGYAGRQPL